MEDLRTSSFWVFMEASLYRHDCLNHWPSVSDSTPSSFIFLGLREKDGSESSQLLVKVGFLGNQPPSLEAYQKFSKSHFININAGVVESGLYVTRCHFTFMALNWGRKKFPLLLSSRKFQRFGELWAKNCGQRPTYLLVTNHNITSMKLKISHRRKIGDFTKCM